MNDIKKLKEDFNNLRFFVNAIYGILPEKQKRECMRLLEALKEQYKDDYR